MTMDFKLSRGLSCEAPVPGRNDGKICWFVPEELDVSHPVGLFIFMHGGDCESPDTAPFDVYLNPENGTLRPHIDNIPFIVAAPSAPSGPDGKRWNRACAVETVEAVIDAACRRAPVDRNRIIIGGHSMGGFGAYHVGQLLADRAAGVWLAAGAWHESDFRSFYGTPVYILHGKYDCAAAYREFHPEPRHHDWCGVCFARAAHELMLRDDVEHVYDEHDGGHGLHWEPAQLALRRFFDWAARQRRRPYAPCAALVTPRGSADPELEERPRSRWLELLRRAPGKIRFDRIELTGPDIARTVDEFQAQSYRLAESFHPGARIIARNCGDNQFSVKLENVLSFAIRLAPEMGELARAFVVDAGNAGCRTLSPQPLEGDPDYCARLVWE